MIVTIDSGVRYLDIFWIGEDDRVKAEIELYDKTYRSHYWYMSMRNRKELLDWIQHTGRTIIHDDEETQCRN